MGARDGLGERRSGAHNAELLLGLQHGVLVYVCYLWQSAEIVGL